MAAKSFLARILNKAKLYLFTEFSSGATPSAGQLALWAKTDDTLHVTNSAASDVVVMTAAAATQTANYVYAGPTTGSAAAATFRLLVAADIPNIAESQVTNLTTDLAAKMAKASNLSDVANVGTSRSNLGLGTMATQQTDNCTFDGDVDFDDNLLLHVGDPTADTNGVNKRYVDNLIAGLRWKQPVACATTANITLSGEQTIDGVLTSASRVLVKDQSTGSQNGIYVSDASTWTRATDADSGTELVNAAVFVTAGTVNADKAWTCTNNSITLGSTSVVFVTFAASIGALLAANNLSDLASASTARTNLGIGNVENTALSTWAGTTNITTLGTIATGVWSGTAITVAKGGTGVTSTTAYAVICGGTTSTGALQPVSGVGTSGQVLTSNGASALPTWQDAAGGGGTGANPSATIGLTAVNGSALTFLRSDGAPALSQAITPTWTGAHIFSSGTTGQGVVVTLQTTALGSNGNRDSPTLVMQGSSYGSSTLYTHKFLTYVEATSTSVSKWHLQCDLNGTTTDALTFTRGTGLVINGTVSASNLSGTNTGDQTITLTGDVTGSGTGSFAATIGSAAVTTAKIADANVTEAKLLIADNTTANATTSAHGFLKKLDNTATHYMDGTGAWSTPAGIAPKRWLGWHQDSQVTIGTQLVSSTSGEWYTQAFQQQISANGDSFQQDILLAAGTYDLLVKGTTGNDRGRVTWNLDSADIITYPQSWHGSSSVAVTKAVHGIVVASDGYHTLKGTASADAGHYKLSLTNFAMVLSSQQFSGPSVSVDFDGTNDIITDSGQTSALNFGGDKLSVCAWVKPSSGHVAFACQRVASSGTLNWQCYTSAGGNVLMTISVSGTGHDYDCGTALTNGTWAHVIWMYDGAKIRIFINGTEQGSGLSLTGNMNSNALATLIGTDNQSNFYKGRACDFRIYQRALSSDERTYVSTVGNLFKNTIPDLAWWLKMNDNTATTAKDHASGYDGTLTNGPTWAADVPT